MAPYNANAKTSSSVLKVSTLNGPSQKVNVEVTVVMPAASRTPPSQYLAEEECKDFTEPCKSTILSILIKVESVHALEVLELPRASHSDKVGSRRLHSMLAAATVLFTHAVVTEI